MVNPFNAGRDTTGEADSRDAPGTVFGERYRIIRPLGEGAVGSRTLLAADLAGGRDVALRRIDTWRDGPVGWLLDTPMPPIAPLFQLAHPHIRPPLDHGENYFVSAYLPGADLAAHLRTTGPLPPDRALHALAQVAAALDYAHAHGVVHGGLCPGNILATEVGHLAVADFGLRAYLEWRCDPPHRFHAGHECYRPTLVPERSAEDDRRALGSVLFHLLAGAPPFPSEEGGDIFTRHGAPPPRLDECGVTGPALALQAAIERAWSRDPAQGFPSGAAMVDAAEAALRA